MKTLDKHGLPVKNCLGLCTDGANSMSGNHNSLFSRLREDNKELVLVECAGHSLDLVASKSMEAIPSAVEHLVRETYSFFAHSSCRQAAELRIRPHKPMRAREKRQDAATPAKRRKLLHHACAMRANEKKGRKIETRAPRHDQ
ncbi:hypothetical protein HPB52_009834 [Rhipicephalus sanguineus]|uniref:DUF4371 domain-containing protein n=1 Tax=Rhipicephalus sanguineus TaxID=34632 RepID=A0A9D4Q8J9_RHISA|nr:hypothetical protein HPB52_009834 [Rhipicephalus sanguineus]